MDADRLKKRVENDNDENLYAENVRQLEQLFPNYLTATSDPRNWEASWFYDFIPYQKDEEVRLCAVLPLMIKEIELSIVSEDMIDEIEGYYNSVIVLGEFDAILKDDEEREMVKEDLIWCYNTAKAKGIIK